MNELATRSRPLVLVVDDMEDARVLLAMTLPMLGFDVAVAADGVEAVGRTQALRPDVVLMDICMPRLDGYGALARLRQHPELARIPVIAFTARADEEDEVRAAGFAAWCTKPCPPDKLAEQLRNVLAAAGRSGR